MLIKQRIRIYQIAGMVKSMRNRSAVFAIDRLLIAVDDVKVERIFFCCKPTWNVN